MKLTTVLILASALSVAASGYGQKAKMSLDIKNGTIEDVFNEIERQSEFNVFYKVGQVDLNKRVDIEEKNVLVSHVLNRVLPSNEASYEVYDRMIVITPNSKDAVKQDITVRGTVTDENGEPLPGVNIMVQGTMSGAVTDLDGNYTISVPSTDAVLVFSYVGYVSDEVPVGGQTEIDITMSPDLQALDEVVVVGYGTQKKSDLTAAISSIDAEDLPKTASLSINNMIQGRVPGVEIVPVNGMPGAGVSIKIRGVGTMNNSEPLYVIDGVHIRNYPGSSSNTLAMINPADIESIEILKDAASTAIYGSGGANGVVLITTKKGSQGKPRINLKTQYGKAYVPKKLDVLDADPYVDLLIEEMANANPNANINDVVGARVLNYDYSRVDRTDWQDEIFRAADLYQADFSVGGGTEFANYMFSLGYADQEAIVVGADYERYTMRLSTDFKIGKRITIGQNFNLAHSNRNDIPSAGRLFIENALRMAPYIPVKDDSNWWGYGNNNNINDNNNADNPFTTLAYEDDETRESLFVGNVFGRVDLFPGLSYYATMSLNYNQSYRSYFQRPHVNSNESEPQEFQEDYVWNMWPKFEQTLTFDRQFDMHQITLLAGMSADRYGRGRTLVVYGTNLPNNNLKNIELAQDSQINSETIRESASLSYFGRLNYSLANKYLLTAIIRRDGSDKFSPDYTWGTFPSVSAAWKLHEEDFIRGTIPAISNLKLRGGWGVVGIDAIDAWQYLSLIHSFGMSYPFGIPGGESLMPGATIKALASPDIKWEEATTTNIGLDFGIWNNSLTLGFDYFTKETKDILVDVPTSPSMGLGLTGGNEGGSRVSNAATTLNKGIEFLLGYNNYSGDFKYGISANFTYVTNEVTGLGEGEPITGPSYNGQAHMTYTQIDYPIGAFYGYRVDKVYEDDTEVQADNDAAVAATGGDVQYYQSDLTQEGDIRFKDLDENGYIDDNDREVIGSPIPKYTYGFAFDAEWRGFDFSMNVSGIADVEIYSAFYTWNLLGMRLTSNHLAEVSDRWTENNRITDMPRAIANDPNNNLRTSDRYIYNGSFLKVRNISLGYTLPAAITNSVGVSSLRVFGTIQNALTISDYVGYDPEVGSFNTDPSGYNLGRGIDQGFVPNPRTFLFGVEVSF